MEKTITDSFGNTITMNYETETDKVLVKNSTIGDTFVEFTINDVMSTPLITVDGFIGENGLRDTNTRAELISFWETNKVNK